MSQPAVRFRTVVRVSSENPGWTHQGGIVFPQFFDNRRLLHVRRLGLYAHLLNRVPVPPSGMPGRPAGGAEERTWICSPLGPARSSKTTRYPLNHSEIGWVFTSSELDTGYSRHTQLCELFVSLFRGKPSENFHHFNRMLWPKALDTDSGKRPLPFSLV